MIAPSAPYPSKTRSGAARLFTMDWHIIVRLLSFIFSNPTKLALEAVSNAPEKMMMEAIDIRDADCGLWKIVVAMKFARSKERNDRAIPVATSKVNAAISKSCISSCLFLALKFAMYFVMAESTPQSRNRVIIMDGIKAMAYNPYSSGSMSLVRTIVPNAIIMVDVVCPMNRWKLPVAEVLPIFNALSMVFCSFWVLNLVVFSNF